MQQHHHTQQEVDPKLLKPSGQLINVRLMRQLITSRIGPLYETIDSRRQQPAVEITGRDRVSSQLLERHEFSEAHLAAAGGSGSVQSEGGMDYEVPQNISMRQIEEHDSEEYSHLQH